MRIIFSVCVFLMSAVSLEAQTRSFDCEGRTSVPRSEAEDIVSRVQGAYSGVRALKGNFFQESFNSSLEMSEVASGRFSFHKPGRMRWDYETPARQTFLVRESTVWLFQEEQAQLLIDEFEKILLTDLPVAFLMGIGDLKSDFNVVSACRNPDGTVLDLHPGPGKGSQLAGFKLLIGPGSSLPAGASVEDVSGNTTSIILTAVETDPELNDREFSPDFPKGIDIQDRRKDRPGS